MWLHSIIPSIWLLLVAAHPLVWQTGCVKPACLLSGVVKGRNLSFPCWSCCLTFCIESSLADFLQSWSGEQMEERGSAVCRGTCAGVVPGIGEGRRTPHASGPCGSFDYITVARFLIVVPSLHTQFHQRWRPFLSSFWDRFELPGLTILLYLCAVESHRSLVF